MSVTVLNTTASLSGKTLAKLEDTQTITGLKTFDLGSSAPFAVVSGAAKVANLDADKLDGQTGADYHDASLLTGTVPLARLGAMGPLACCCRLSLTTGVPLTIGDVTAATSVFFSPFKGNLISLYASGAWAPYTFTQLSIALGADAASLPYDVFAYVSAGAVAIERLAWTNTTTRATGIDLLQDGTYCKTGDATRRYIGTYYTTGVGQCTDSALVRGVWNYAIRAERLLQKLITTDSYTYTTATTRQWEGSTANQVAIMVGVAEDIFELEALHTSINTSANVERRIGIGEGSTTTMVDSLRTGPNVVTPANQSASHYTKLRKVPAVGYQFYAGLERSDASGTSTWIGDNGSTIAQQSGLNGKIWA